MGRGRQAQDKVILRLLDGLRDTIKDTAARNRRSMNAEIVFHLERVFLMPERPPLANLPRLRRGEAAFEEVSE